MSTPGTSSPRQAAFDVMVDGVREPWWIRTRRLVVLSAIIVLTILGALDVITTVIGRLRPSSPISAPGIADGALDAVAEGVAVDYLSWDAEDRARREQVLRRWAVPGRDVDGWDGQGRQSADSATVLARARQDLGNAVVTVRVRVVPYTVDGTSGPPDQAPPQSPDHDPGPSSPDTEPGVPAAQPAPQTLPGWRAHPARWLIVAVPLALHEGRLLLAASPALVGDPGTDAPELLPAGNATSDDRFSRDTRSSVRTFFEALATGDLDFVRAPRARIASLQGAAVLVEVRQWRGVQAPPGKSPEQRMGVASVVWRTVENAGQLTCTYRLRLHRQDDRWLLAAIGIDTGTSP
ncbi:conjugal transfer protein [Saccharothrix xinjiangensis]|uniref:Conjugal transfer protein n=1 Tax=Saccharothrix xinjiangensis TaxID=204798 RepID=A0ABV9Y0S9_9PSEU